MNKYILLAAMAATVMPGAAIAREHNHGRHHHRTEVRHHHAGRGDRDDSRSHRRNFTRSRAHRAHSAYYAPVRNWRYRPVYVGYVLQPSFYGSRYYISDYGVYHVRRPSRWHEWIRYGNDLLLVNIRTGRVLEVIHYAGW
jgi:Ni/Co efflux regulator RcnB